MEQVLQTANGSLGWNIPGQTKDMRDRLERGLEHLIQTRLQPILGDPGSLCFILCLFLTILIIFKCTIQ